jgi:RNA polymerase sigma factor (sigma-70 family)
MKVESLSVEDLVAEANDGNPAAWNAIVDRFGSLVWSICLSFRLSEADAADVSQTVWLRTIEHLSSIRVPAALPGWIATTTRRECIKVVTVTKRGPRPLDDLTMDRNVDTESTALDAELLSAERRAMVREAFAQLPEHCQRLLAMLVGSEPKKYAEISEHLDIPVGSIGPTRARCLDKLRSCPAVALWMKSDGAHGEGDDHNV